MKSTQFFLILIALCSRAEGLYAQGWGDPSLLSTSSSVTTESDLNWMTLNRASIAEADRPNFVPENSSQDPFLSQTAHQSSSSPGSYPTQQTGYATLDLLPNEMPPVVPPRGGPPVGVPMVSIAFDARWEPKDDGFGVKEVWGGVKKPLGPPLFGGAPPMISFNFGITDLDGSTFGEFFDFSIGLSWVKPVNQQWTWMFGFKPGIATDFDNTSSEMWRIRANAFAIYAQSPMTQWIMGAVVTGRSDIPVLPAIGLIWWPTQTTKVDLTFPRPRVAWLVNSSGSREHWMYVGGELGGGTWAVGLPGGFEDELTYRAYRFAVGMEFLPAGVRKPGAQPVIGESAYVEAGLSFNREIEFESLAGSFEPDSVLYLGGGFRF